MQRQGRQAFTLIELLAAMTILTVMVLLISKVFVESSNLWKGGEKRIQSFADGRAVVELLTTELSSAVADKNVLRLKLRSDANTQIFGGAMKADEIVFMTSEGQATVINTKYARQAHGVMYAVTKMKTSDDNDDADSRWRIMRYPHPDSFSDKPYNDQTNWINGIKGAGQGSALAENVRTLEFWVYDTNGVSHYNYDSFVHGPPSRIEVYLEMLGEDDALRASLINRSSPAEADKFAEKRVRRFVGRAYPQFSTAYTE